VGVEPTYEMSHMFGIPDTDDIVQRNIPVVNQFCLFDYLQFFTNWKVQKHAHYLPLCGFSLVYVIKVGSCGEEEVNEWCCHGYHR
jgi:hypothetical protein